jgi:hypothetical protein
MSRHKQTNFVSYTDLLFNLLIGITFLFILAFILIKPSEDAKKIDSKAEFLIVLEWPDHHNSDIDLWVQDPDMNAIGFTSKTKDVTTLERDDIGSASDTHLDSAGRVVYDPVNREVTTIRAIKQGEWAVNVHYYRSRAIPKDHVSGVVTPPYEYETKIPVEVEVKVIKLNPTYRTIATKKILLTFQGEERTITRFEINEHGEVVRFIGQPINFVIESDIGDFDR